MIELAGEQNPFLRYRERLDSYRLNVVEQGVLNDAQFVDLVGELDAKVAQVWGRGFVVSPLVDGSALAAAAGLDTQLSIKVEANSVGGSHKARHLFGTAILYAIKQQQDDSLSADQKRFAIASCGNAAMGAAVVARATNRPLDVFVPTWADESVVTALADLGATVNRCERREGEAGDPCYLRFLEAVADGALPFGVQSNDTPIVFDGAQTLGWEITEQVEAAGLPAVDSLFIQVGGGALATSVSNGMPATTLYPVQAEGCAPLRRAWDRWDVGNYDALGDSANEFMTPWEDPSSLATGILDDITYDWMPLLANTHASGGEPIVAPEPLVESAYALAHQHTDINVCSTGTAGFAGLLAEPARAGAHTVVLFTGIDRT